MNIVYHSPKSFQNRKKHWNPPLLWRNLICLRMVDFPHSPGPSKSTLTIFDSSSRYLARLRSIFLLITLAPSEPQSGSVKMWLVEDLSTCNSDFNSQFSKTLGSNSSFIFEQRNSQLAIFGLPN